MPVRREEGAVNQLDLNYARAERDAGMRQATDHAEAETPGWSAQALAYLRQYAERRDRFPGWFVTEEAALSGEVPEPPTKKAWGSIFTKAARHGWIVKDGYRPDPHRHANPCPVWRSLVYRP